MTHTDARRATVERLMRRLQRLYAERAPLPRCDGRHVYPCEEVKTGRCVCADQDGCVIGLALLQRLYRYVISEGYGL